MTFSSVTTWEAESFEVEVRFGVFATISEAAAMGRCGIETVFLDGLGMWADLSDGTRAPIRPEGVTVRRLRHDAAEAARHRVLTDDDFESVVMSIDDMRRNPDMRKGFGSQAYGVVDAAGKRVALGDAEPIGKGEATMTMIAHCIECGCHDYAACHDEVSGGPCSWLAVDYTAKVGVCSACPESMTRWNAGDRSLSVPVDVNDH